MVKKSRGQGKKNRATPKQVVKRKAKVADFRVEHPTVVRARYELMLIGEEPETIDWYCSILEKWASYGHSGTSAEVTADVLNRLMKGENLAPLTSDPDEWTDRSEISGYPLWQNNRNTQIFSKDGGATALHYSELEEADGA